MNFKKILKNILILTCAMCAACADATPEADFWKWFQKNEAMLFNFEKNQEKTFDQLAREMHKVHPSLTFEFGPKENDQREFVISADGIHDAFPKVESLFATAPQLPKWKFIKFRPRRQPFDLQFNGISVRSAEVSIWAQPAGDLVDITVYIPGYNKTNHKTYVGMAFLFLDQALGEFDVETKVGKISVNDKSVANSAAVSLSQFPRVFDASIAK